MDSSRRTPNASSAITTGVPIGASGVSEASPPKPKADTRLLRTVDTVGFSRSAWAAVTAPATAGSVLLAGCTTVLRTSSVPLGMAVMTLRSAPAGMPTGRLRTKFLTGSLDGFAEDFFAAGLVSAGSTASELSGSAPSVSTGSPLLSVGPSC
jgi:hypothetical protein